MTDEPHRSRVIQWVKQHESSTHEDTAPLLNPVTGQPVRCVESGTDPDGTPWYRLHPEDAEALRGLDDVDPIDSDPIDWATILIEEQ